MLTVLQSSAGAGKTHTLVKHYLTHCLRTPRSNAYAQVLALTFTIKAAGEMKERVIEYLHRLSKDGTEDDGPITDVADHLMQAGSLSREELSERARATLSHMLHHWSDVSISTIDSFTRKVIRPFARDLRLDHDLQMTTEIDHYMRSAVDRLLDRAGRDKDITTILERACADLLEEEGKWRPDLPLLKLTKELEQERSIDALRSLKDIGPETFLRLNTVLRGRLREFEEQVSSVATRAIASITDAGLSPADLAHGAKGFHGYFRKLVVDPATMAGPNSHVLALVAGGKKWHSAKASTDAIARIEAIGPTLLQCYEQAEELRAVGYASHLTARAILRELMPTAALHELGEHLEEAKQEDNVLFFSDLTRRVADVVREEPVPFIHERMGERYRHYMIDEFQDTSLLQWHSLIPLVENALANGGSALLVGDAKQAIYRWRNGEVRQFIELPAIFEKERLPDGTLREAVFREHFQESSALDRNHRSGTAIVGFNNAFFGKLSPLLSPDLERVYKGHDQAASRMHIGYVHIDLVDSFASGDEGRSERMDRMVAFADGALRDGFEPGDIAVLVRSRSQGSIVASALMNAGHEVVSVDALLLDIDAAVGAIVNTLRFIHFEEETTAAKALQHMAVLRVEIGTTTVDPFGNEAERLPRPASRLRRFLRSAEIGDTHRTPAELIDRIAHALHVEPTTDAYLMTLLNEAFQHGIRYGADLGAFLAHWERVGEKRSVSPTEHSGAIRIMTIHASKGLQFPVVLVPFMEMRPKKNDGLLWVDPGPIAPDLPAALIRSSKPLLEAGVPEVVHEETLRELDDLNLLYVAFTRPTDRLYAIATAKGSGQTADWYAALRTMAQEDTLSIGERSGPSAPRKSGTEKSLSHLKADGERVSLGIRKEAPRGWDPADPDPYRSLGIAVHQILSEVRVPSDVEPAIGRAVALGSIDLQQGDELSGTLSDVLGRPELQPYFGAGMEVRTEATLILKDGSNARPDRVVLDGSVMRVLDIKTGKPLEGHSDQVRAYMQHLKDAGADTVEGALLYLPEGHLETVPMT